jgi:hypothetical protein
MVKPLRSRYPTILHAVYHEPRVFLDYHELGARAQVALPSHALRVQARLVSGTSVLLGEATILSEEIMAAVGFYVWANPD